MSSLLRFHYGGIRLSHDIQAWGKAFPFSLSSMQKWTPVSWRPGIKSDEARSRWIWKKAMSTISKSFRKSELIICPLGPDLNQLNKKCKTREQNSTHTKKRRRGTSFFGLWVPIVLTPNWQSSSKESEASGTWFLADPGTVPWCPWEPRLKIADLAARVQTEVQRPWAAWNPNDFDGSKDEDDQEVLHHWSRRSKTLKMKMAMKRRKRKRTLRMKICQVMICRRMDRDRAIQCQPRCLSNGTSISGECSSEEREKTKGF